MEPGLATWVMAHDEVAVAGAWSFLHERDCGIYAVGDSAGVAASGPGAKPAGTRACRCSSPGSADRDAAIDTNRAASLRVVWL